MTVCEEVETCGRWFRRGRETRAERAGNMFGAGRVRRGSPDPAETPDHMFGAGLPTPPKRPTAGLLYFSP